MTENYFNTHIIERHDVQLGLNNCMAEHFSFCLSLPWNSDADNAWNYDMKRAHICYDV